ncbi:MAG: hypothetical protein IPH94_12405 [Saprospiraceae bacterium]|nr:hypothetical protein [Saprospiraceae bacterium]MBL0082982.1 hypothetical protein [Saprospiraceae bacterium]
MHEIINDHCGYFTFTLCCKKENSKPTSCETNCSLLPEMGPCHAAFQRFYFDKIEKKCLPFAGMQWVTNVYPLYYRYNKTPDFSFNGQIT